MTRKLFIAAILLLTLQYSSVAQYYYKDILGTQQVMAERKALQEQKKRTVTVNSFESDGTASVGFFCVKKISKDYRKIETYTKSLATGRSIVTSFFDKTGLLLRTTDSSETNFSSIDYTYDNKKNITVITSLSKSSDYDFVNSLVEVRQYTYNDKSLPIKMTLTRNNKDSLEVDFSVDDSGHVSEEQEVAVYGKHYYYYYDDNNMITDIVRYNLVKQKVVPDFLFEYNDAGQMVQMIATEEGVSGNYYLWKYTYNGKLRTEDKCYSKDKQLQGYFQYEYE
ncbi:MAG TPA: hypothetical protein VK559_01290 [Ferruginibacter sp.]|nr:hypothetical protein [Ferruginibacter sp.]